MTSIEIKNECMHLYAIIQRAKDRLGAIRIICPHEHTFEGEYQYRVGASLPALICEDCGQVIKSLI